MGWQDSPPMAAAPAWASAPAAEEAPSWASAPTVSTAPVTTPIDPDANVRKFLNFLGKAEGADYDTVVGGSKFSDFRAHPRIVGLRTAEGPSTAAGKYQIVGTTYDDVAPKIGVRDFSPDSQDKIAVELIRRKGALEDVRSGNFQAAIDKLGGTWASLPSSPYSQPKRSAEWASKELGLASDTTYQGFAPVRKDVDPKTLNSDQDWLKASMLMYNFWERKPYEGTQNDLAEWGKDSLGNFNYNLVSMAEIANALRSASQEEKEAFLYMMDTYDNTNFSLEGTGRAFKGIATDPTTIVGLGTLGIGFAGKALGKQAIKQGIKKIVIDSMARTGIVAGVESAVFSAADSTIRQSVEVNAGRRTEIDLSKVGVDATIGGVAGLVLGTAADAAITGIVKAIKGTPEVPTGAARTTPEATPNVSGVTPQVEPKVASGAATDPLGQMDLFARQQDGRLAADEIVPNVGTNVPKIDVPELNTGLRTTRVTDEPVAKLGKQELGDLGEVVVKQIREVETKDLPSVLENLRTRDDLSREEIRIVDKAVQNYKNEVVTELAAARTERLALDAKVNLTDVEIAKHQELEARIADLEERSAVTVKADDATGSMAGSILQDRQDPMNALKGVTVESIMSEKGVTKLEAEQVWAEMVGKANLETEAQKISGAYDAKATAALDNDDLAGAAMAAVQKHRELDAKVEALAPKASSFIDKLGEFFISNVFSIKTIIINLIPSGLKTLVIPGLKAVLNNPFEKATRVEAAAAYSAMRSSFGGALKAAAAGFRYEQAILTRDGTRLVEGEMAMKGKLAGAWRIFPRILNASDEFLSKLNYDSFIAGRAAAQAAIEGTEKGLKGKALDDFIKDASTKALDDAMRPVSGDELVSPIINKGLNLGLTGEDLFKYVEREAMRDPQALRKGNDEDALNFVRDVLYKRKFSGENGASKAAQWYEDGMKKFPSIKLVVGQLFFRTPVRVFEEGIRLTPGIQFLAPGFLKDLQGANGPLRQVRAQAEAMSSLVVASGVLSLYAQGRITGDGAYSDYKQQKNRVDGPQAEPYTIKMSDGSTWSYRGFDPIATPVKIMVNALERMDKLRIREAQGEFVDKSFYKEPLALISVGVMSIATAIRDASLVEGASNFSKFVKTAFNPEEGESAFIKALGDKLFLLVPNTLHKIARDNDPQIRDPVTFWQMVEQKLLRPVGLSENKTSFAYDVLGNIRKSNDTGALWNVFSTASVEERTKGMSEKEQFVLTEMDRLARTTGFIAKPPIKHPDFGDTDMRTIMAADGKRTIYDVWQQNYKAQNPVDPLYDVLSSQAPEGTFKYAGVKEETVRKIISDYQNNAFQITMSQEQKVMDKFISETLLKAKSNAGLFATPRPY